jgi:hypothetical protein
VPLGLEEKPSAVEQIQTATVVGYCAKRQRTKSCKFIKHKASTAKLEGILLPHGNKCAGVGCNFVNSSCGNKAKLIDIGYSEIPKSNLPKHRQSKFCRK